MTDNKGPDDYRSWEIPSSIHWYILKHRKPVRCYDMRKVEKNLSYRNKCVRRTYLPNNTLISTIFLGLDHQYNNPEVPLLFETMINVNGDFLDYQTRCSTWRQALKMHWKAVEAAKRDR